MNIFMRFPEGKRKAITLSYDDGVEQDVRLISIMNKHGLKGTFNINSARYALENCSYSHGTIHRRMTRKECQEVYLSNGMEVAVHGLTHSFLEGLTPALCTKEILQDRYNLEEDFNCLVRGMAYPYGSYNESVLESARLSGIVYARVVETTEKFDIPTDWLRLRGTCHHNNPRLMELAKSFVEDNSKRDPKLFYLWGHSYEFEANNNWQIIEQFAKYVGNREDIWYATNIEIYDYITAYNQLIFSISGNLVYNPTCVKVFFETENIVYSVAPGQYCNLLING